MKNDLLSWFGSDKKLAEARLESFRRRLVHWFGKKGCKTHEDCEDNTTDTFIRTSKILAEKPEVLEITPEKFINGVAKKVLQEYWKKISKAPKRLPDSPISELFPMSESEDTEDAIVEQLELERHLECLEKCMQELTPNERAIIEQFSQSDKHYSKKLIKQFGGTPNALRLRIFHTIRNKLRPCVINCLKK